MIEPEPFLRRSQIARLMGVSVRTVDHWAHEGAPHETWGLRTKVFRASDMIAWAKNRAEGARR